MIDLEKLRAAAEAATPGPWKTTEIIGIRFGAAIEKQGPGFEDYETVAETKGEQPDQQRMSNAAYIAAANPAAMIELLDRLAFVEAANVKLHDNLEKTENELIALKESISPMSGPSLIAAGLITPARQRQD